MYVLARDNKYVLSRDSKYVMVRDNKYVVSRDNKYTDTDSGAREAGRKERGHHTNGSPLRASSFRVRWLCKS